jgi:hypothetical protein
MFSSGLFIIFVIGLGFILRASSEQPPTFHERTDLVTGSSALKDVGSTKADGGTNLPPGVGADGQYHFDDISELLTPENHAASNENTKIKHHEVFSNMTADGKFFMVDFIDEGSYNPNFLPHFYKEDTFVMIAQRDKQHDDNTIWNVELVCDAKFMNGKMTCVKSPMNLPIASTMSTFCTEDMDYFNNQIGPHDARVFYGPKAPYIVWMSQSPFNCLGQWIQDLRRITDWHRSPTTNISDPFFYPTILQRPPPYGRIEKNWYVFWDYSGEMYLHYDTTANTRVFAKLAVDGSVGPDLAPATAAHDAQCMEKLMPKIRAKPFPEWLHQATNSLAVTLCRRADPTCHATQDNTFILALFQTKTFYYHGVYEPYFMLFQQTAPFAVYGITTVPVWYHGRGKPHGNWTEGTTKPKDQSQMIFTTSISWKTPGKMYHGFLDDEVLIGFGVEDQASAGMDVVMGDLLADLETCDGKEWRVEMIQEEEDEEFAGEDIMR